MAEIDQAEERSRLMMVFVASISLIYLVTLLNVTIAAAYIL